MVVLTRKQLDKIQARKIRLIRFIYLYTGEWVQLSHPYLWSFRLCWTSNARPGSIPAHHLPFTYRSSK